MNKEILRLAIPNILSNISVPLLSTVDTALMGRLSAMHIAAVGVGGMIFNFIYWNFGFLRMGTTGMTAQAFGAEDTDEQAKILNQAIIVALALSFAIIVFSVPLMQSAKYLLNLEAEQSVIVQDYFFIRIFDAPASMLLYVLMGWLFGMQNAIYPLILTVSINVLNIGLSFYLVAYLGWEIEGVAWGTVIAQYSGVLIALLLLFLRYPQIFKSALLRLHIKWEELKHFLSINSDIFIRTICLTLAFGFFYSQSSDLGSGILAANVILLLFVNWMSYIIDGFAYAAESIVGKYKGMTNDEKTMRAIVEIFKWSAAMALLITLCYAAFSRELTMVFTNQMDVVDVVQKYQIWVIGFPVFAFACYIWDGVFIGLTAVNAMRNTMLMAFLLYIPTLLIGRMYFGNHGLWAGLLLLMIYRGCFQWIVFRRQGLELK